jgi:hypothetical protein
MKKLIPGLTEKQIKAFEIIEFEKNALNNSLDLMTFFNTVSEDPYLCIQNTMYIAQRLIDQLRILGYDHLNHETIYSARLGEKREKLSGLQTNEKP